MHLNSTDILMENTLITGGHIMVDAGDNINEGTVRSFKMAVTMFAENKQNYQNLGLGILVNDIGATCSETSCSVLSTIKLEHFELPEKYKDILEMLKVPMDDLKLISERHCRNRGKKVLSKELRKKNPNIVFNGDGYYYIDNDRDLEIQLTRINRFDEIGTPACPLIMCAFTLEHVRNGYNNSINFYYTGEDNIANIPNYYVIEKGYQVALNLNDSVNVKNIYIFEDNIMKNF